MGTFIRFVAGSLALLVWTWLWLLPVAGFHHMVRCGVLGWAILDWENGPIEIRWSSLVLLLSLAIWVSPVGFFLWLRRVPTASHS